MRFFEISSGLRVPVSAEEQELLDAVRPIVTDTMMQTSIPGLFAAGDLRSQLTRQVTTAVGDATTAAIAAKKYLKGLHDGEREPVIQGTGGYTA